MSDAAGGVGDIADEIRLHRFLSKFRISTAHQPRVIGEWGCVCVCVFACMRVYVEH